MPYCTLQADFTWLQQPLQIHYFKTTAINTAEREMKSSAKAKEIDDQMLNNLLTYKFLMPCSSGK